MGSKADMGSKQSAGKTTVRPVRPRDVEFSWLSIAKDELGTKEVPGTGNNPRVVEYHQTTTLRAKADAVPWCSSFVNWCMIQAGYKGTNSAAARSWLGYGRKVYEQIPVGTIAIFKRQGGHHVGFVLEWTPLEVTLLGGNQSDAVNIRKFGTSQLLGLVLPDPLNDDDQEVWEEFCKGLQ